MADLRCKFEWKLQDRGWIRTRLVVRIIYIFEQNEYNSCPILELSVKFASEICHEKTNKPVDGAYLADFGIDINLCDKMLLLIATV